MTKQIEPCPNPECHSGTIAVISNDRVPAFVSVCCSCGYQGPHAWKDDETAIAMHNRIARAVREVQEQRDRAEKAEAERDGAISMLAAWCVDVDQNGTGWDDWDENYKDAMYREGPLRELLDKEIERIRAERRDWSSTP